MTKAVYEMLLGYMQSCVADRAHDENHVLRVLSNALQIAREEPQADLDILMAACLLHDVARREEMETPGVRHAAACRGEHAVGDSVNHAMVLIKIVPLRIPNAVAYLPVRAHLINRIARRAVIQQHPRRTQRPGGVQLVRVKEDFFLDARRRRAAAKAVRGDAIRHTAAKFG